MRWSRVSCPDSQCSPRATRTLTVGCQKCEPGGSFGMQVCVDQGGTTVGHIDNFGRDYASHCGPRYDPAQHLGCWVPSQTTGSQQLDDFWRADFASENLTWTAFKTGDAVPTNAYTINGQVFGPGR